MDLNSPLNYNYNYRYPMNLESPETVLARSSPLSTLRLLNKESKRKHYVEALSLGADITQNYISNLESENLSKIKQIKIEPEVWGGFGKGKGMVISFKRKW